MFTKLLSKLSPAQRDSLFTRIRSLVLEIDAADRSLDGIGEGLAIDEVLEEIAGELDAERADGDGSRYLKTPGRVHTRWVVRSIPLALVCCWAGYEDATGLLPQKDAETGFAPQRAVFRPATAPVTPLYPPRRAKPCRSLPLWPR
jgi:hypothetical protein